MKNFRHTICCFILIALIQISCAQTKKTGQGKKPFIVFVAGDHEYSGESTLPLLAAELEKNYGFKTKVVTSSPDQNAEENIPGLEILKEADIAVFFSAVATLACRSIETY